MAIGPKFSMENILNSMESEIDSHIARMGPGEVCLHVDLTKYLNYKGVNINQLKEKLIKKYKDAEWMEVSFKHHIGYQFGEGPYLGITLIAP